MTDLQARIAALSPAQRARLETRMADLAAANGSGHSELIPPRDRGRPTPLSYAQQREWALERFRPSNNISAAIRLQGDVDLELLGRVLTEVMARHEVLRSTVEIIDRVPVQVVHPVTAVPVEVHDISDLEPERQEVEVRRRYDAEVVRLFPPEQTQRMRAVALRLGPDHYVALVTIHHSSSDGWSMAVVLREVAQLYPAFRAGQPSPLPPIPIQYGDFAVWQREYLGPEWMAAEVEYWRATLAGIPPRLALPTDRPYPARRTFAGSHFTLSLDTATTHALQRFAEIEGVSVSMIMLAAASVVLYRYTDQDDLVFGSAITGRVRTETEWLIGCFANALPLRMRMLRDDTLLRVLHRARDVVSAAFDHQDIPFDRLIEELAPKETSQTPLIQMMINVLTAPGTVLRLENQTLEMPGLRVRPVPMSPGPIPIDLSLNVQAMADSVHLQWHYSTELFEDRTVRRLAEQLERVLRRLVDAPETRVGDPDLLATAARTAPAVRAAGTGETFVDLFQRQVRLAPDAPAVVCGGAVTTFAALNREANRLAHHLRGLGVGAESTVGVLLDRAPHLAVAVLGVLKAGAAYVPIDSAYPADRIGYLLDDARAAAVVTAGALASLAGTSAAHTVLLDGPDLSGPDTDPEGGPAGTSSAYVVYTSGSTGLPKGVVVEHRSLVTFAREVAERLQLGAGDRFLQFASPGFDVLAEELFPIWLAGGAVVIPPKAMTGPGLDLIQLAERDRISVMELPAAYWHEWVRELDRTGRTLPGSLRLVIVGAERVLPERLAMWQKLGVPLMHVYGITETTVSSTFFRLPPDADPADLRHLPIGTPLPSADLRILDADLRPVPAGAVGELYIAGISVARGYLRRPGLTAQRFVADPEHPGERMYRTGDLVRQRADGNLEFLSRVDTQIKIRGFRVEPAEIESAMCRHPQIAQAVVTVYEPAPGDRRLVGYLVPQARTRPSITDVRRFLARELPPYLVPAAFVQLDTLPLTANGKVDHDRLPEPAAERPELVEDLVLPETPLERQLAEIVAGVLGVTVVGANDNFFDLGGDSILAIQVVARAEEAGIDLSPLDLFEHPTVAGLTQVARIATATGVTPRDPDAEPVLSFEQERRWREDRRQPGKAATVGALQRLTGPLDVPALEAAIRAILARHEVLRSRFPEVDGRPAQVVGEPDPGWRLRVEDVSGLDGDREAAARRLTDEVATAGFDLANGPLLRCLLVRLDETEHILAVVAHHIVADFTSTGLFARELTALYRAGGDADRAELPALPVQYLDFAVWQRGRLTGDELTRQVEHWRAHLDGAPPAITLPVAGEPDPTRGERGRLAVSVEEVGALRELCRKLEVTPFMAVLAGFATALGGSAGQSEVVVGVSISNRTDAAVQDLVGPFLNTLPLRVDLSGEPDFADLLGRVRQAAVAGYANAEAPIDHVVRAVGASEDGDRAPLFQVYLNHVEIPPVARIGDVALTPVGVPALPADHEVVLTAEEHPDSLRLILDFDAGRYAEATMRTIAERCAARLRAAAAGTS